ncbi:putative Ig domain-containing protein [Pelagicoccus mobilis]|uniref:Ig domain-containing protein n=1 Tax=Pelagicoccus mobilis TaxID=415221 RepID=A0A934RTT3_9BACT|nr:putative Ig domain-containing protein [Pelagicoccus mobilis]MBK1877480.1 putative Ig domain-containing protein [Pelagicoccus mobilis]
MTRTALLSERLPIFWKPLLLLATLLCATQNSIAQGTPDSPEEELLINAVAGYELNFPLDPTSEITGIQFAELPEGLVHDSTTQTITGIPTQIGVLESTVSFTEAGVAKSIPARFEVFDPNNFTGDPHNPNPKDEHHAPQPHYIPGKVGQQLYWQVDFPVYSSEYDFGVTPTGLPSTTPPGVEFVAGEASFIGTPSAHGDYYFVFLVNDSTESYEVHYLFQIEPAEGGTDADGDGIPDDSTGVGHTDPTGSHEEDDTLFITAILGHPLDFPIDAPAEITIQGVNGLPAGLYYDADKRSIAGTPTETGHFDASISFVEAGVSGEHPVKIDVLHDDGTAVGNPGDGASGPETHYIHGNVGSELDYNIFLLAKGEAIDFGTRPDGTAFELPPGISYNVEASSFIGVPQEEGESDFVIVIPDETQSYEVHYRFLIGPSDGTHVNPEPLHIHGNVGEPLYFQVPVAIAGAGFDFATRPDGTPFELPLGIGFNAEEVSFSGTPEEAGDFDFGLLVFDPTGNGYEMPIIFHFGEEGDSAGNPTDPNPHPHETPRIFGIVGEPIEYHLPFDLTDFGIDFASRADGTPYELPQGIEFNVSESLFSGTPEEAGIFGFALLLTSEDGTHEEHFIFDFIDNTSHNPGYTEEAIHIVGNVGEELGFALPLEDDVSHLEFDWLPEGIQFNPETRTLVGKPLYPGYYEIALHALRGEENILYPVFFDIFGDSHDHGGHGEEFKVHGWVGEFMSFPLPFDTASTEVELTTYSDGTAAVIPVGIELDQDNAFFVGYPQEPGFYASSITITDSTETRDIPVYFDILHMEGHHDGHHQPDHHEGPRDIVLFSEVGARFSFKFPLTDSEQAFLKDSNGDEKLDLPTGLNYDPDNLAITGSPSKAGVYRQVVLIEGPDFNEEFNLIFLVSDPRPAPRLSFYSESEYTPGDPFRFQIPATGSPTKYDVIGLPDGAQIDAETGVVSGTIEKDEDFDLLVSAANEDGIAYGIHFLDAEYEREDDPTAPENPHPETSEEEDVEPFFARLGVPFRLEAPSEYSEAAFAVIEGEAFPDGISLDPEENAVISGTPTEAGLFSTKISITRDSITETFTLWFFVADSASAPQILAEDFIHRRVGESFDLTLPIVNGPAEIEIIRAPEGVSFDSASNSIRGVISEAGRYDILLTAKNDHGLGVHYVEVDIWQDDSGYNPGEAEIHPHYAFGIVGEALHFPLPIDPAKSQLKFVANDEGTESTIPPGLSFIEDFAIIKGVPEKEGFFDVFLEITEYGFTRREHIIFEIYNHDSVPTNPDFPEPGHEEPDDGHVEPILGKVGERLYFEAPISGENISFELVTGPDGSASDLPPGVEFDPQLGILSGVPTASGIYPIWVKVDENGSVRTHFAPIIVSGVEGSPVIVSSDFITTAPGEHFTHQLAVENEPSEVSIEFFDVPGVLSFDPDSLLLEGKFEFGGFYILLASATNEVGTGYGLIYIDVLGLNSDGSMPHDIPLHINGEVNKEVDFELPSFIRGSSFVIGTDPAGIETDLPNGLTIDERTGRISGTPTESGYSFVWVIVDDGELPSLAINIGVAEGMLTPMIISPEVWVGHQDEEFYYHVHATDFPSAYYADGLPEGLSLDEQTGLISGIPSVSGDFEVQVSAENEAGLGETRKLLIFIEEKIRLPILSAPFFVEGIAGEALSIEVSATESPDTFSAHGLPEGMSINASTGSVSGTPAHPGYYEATVIAENEHGHGKVFIGIYIKRPAQAPVYTGPEHTGGKVGESFQFQLNVSGNVDIYSFAGDGGGFPAGLLLDTETGLLSGTPTEVFSDYVEFFAYGPGGTTYFKVYIKVAPALNAPEITSSPFAMGTAGSAFDYQATASNDALEFDALFLPEGLSIDSSTGLISGTPESAGYHDVFLRARNDAGWGRARLLVLDIIPGLAAPTIISAPYAKGEVGKAFSYTIEANNSPSTYSVSGDLPAGLELDASNGVIAGTPSEAGLSEVLIFASNESGAGNALLFLIAIRPSQEMPVVTSSGTAFGKVGEQFVYQIKASGNPTSFESSELPDGLVLNETTGLISGKPTAPTDEPILIVLTAQNAAGSSLPRALLLEVLPAAEAPVLLSGAHAKGKVGVEFEFQVHATNDPTAYSSPDLPAGLSIASDTGLISGTPEKPGEFHVTLKASNNAGTGEPAVLLLYILPSAEVANVTSAPLAEGKVGDDFEYQITASEEEIDSFQVEGELPRGLDFDPTTGLISGTPVDPVAVTVHLSVSNEAGVSAPQPLTITIEPSLEAPVITSSLHAPGTVGEDFAYTVDATNMPEERPLPPSAEFDAVGLPGGLAINTATGIISGSPEEAGTFEATIVATNEAGEGAPRILSIKIDPAPTAPEVVSVVRVSAQVGQVFNYQIEATNSPTSYDADHSIPWLIANTDTGVLSGTPSKPGVYIAALFASNEAGRSDPGPLEITVYPAANTPKITSDRTADGKVGTAFEYQIEATNDPTSYAVSGLPSGLALDAETGLISGTPNASGTFEIIVVASNANGEGAETLLVLEIEQKVKFTLIIPGT